VSAQPEPSAARRRDRGSRLPPLPLAASIAMLMWFVARATPSLAGSFAGSGATAIALMVAAAAVGLAGLLEFRRAQTTVNPLRPAKASALVTGGIYRFTRNPMYLALATALLAWAAYLGHALAPLGVALFVAWLNRFQIAPEERALTALFGDEFVRYCRAVRRWI